MYRPLLEISMVDLAATADDVNVPGGDGSLRRPRAPHNLRGVEGRAANTILRAQHALPGPTHGIAEGNEFVGRQRPHAKPGRAEEPNTGPALAIVADEVRDPTTVTSNGGGSTLTGGPGLNLYYGNGSDITDFDPSSGAVFVKV
jgi:hypothetical protein